MPERRLDDQHGLDVERQYDFMVNARVRRDLLDLNDVVGTDLIALEHAGLEPKGHETVLDIGCGDGSDLLRWSVDFSHQGPLIGMEIPTEHFAERFMVTEIKAKEAGVENLHFVRGYAEAIPLPRNSADILMANWVFYHFSDIAKAIDEIKRVVKPGGKIAIATNGPENKLEHHAILRSMAEDMTEMGGGLGEDINPLVRPPSPFSRKFSSAYARRLLPKHFQVDDEINQRSVYKIDLETLALLFWSIDSYRFSFEPPNLAALMYKKAREKQFDKLKQEIKEVGAFYDSIDRSIFICRNLK
jgi:ubiquinone/menaquinone biosynthesis C-methylase UbiE